MEPYEIIACSLTSKKVLSIVQSLGLSLRSAKIKMKELPEIYLSFGSIILQFKRRMGKNGKRMTRIDDIPIGVDVSIRKRCARLNRITGRFRENVDFKVATWSNPGKSIGEWIKHIYSIFRCKCYEAEFHVGKIRVDIQSLRNAFPKLRETVIHGSLEEEPNDQEIQNTQIILRAFLPYVKNVELHDVHLQENLCLQHIGMANLRSLLIDSPNSPKFDDILTLNVERCAIRGNHFSFRNLNRFFKLWTKGSFPKLKYLTVEVENIVDWTVLMKGLKAEEAEVDEVDEKQYTIHNCYGNRAEIEECYNKADIFGMPDYVSIEFYVFN
ncbi:hypothetical protein B9Z55_011135 [Caenorhabditis nigoni]|nr:hypothetical protein B9Z55_011135 [Caenorhabditis nigoni]